MKVLARSVILDIALYVKVFLRVTEILGEEDLLWQRCDMVSSASMLLMAGPRDIICRKMSRDLWKRIRALLRKEADPSSPFPHPRSEKELTAMKVAELRALGESWKHTWVGKGKRAMIQEILELQEAAMRRQEDDTVDERDRPALEAAFHRRIPLAEARVKYCLPDADVANLPCEWLPDPTSPFSGVGVEPASFYDGKVCTVYERDARALARTRYTYEANMPPHPSLWDETTLTPEQEERKQALRTALLGFGGAYHPDLPGVQTYVSTGEGSLDDLVFQLCAYDFAHRVVQYPRYTEFVRRVITFFENRPYPILAASRQVATREWLEQFETLEDALRAPEVSPLLHDHLRTLWLETRLDPWRTTPPPAPPSPAPSAAPSPKRRGRPPKSSAPPTVAPSPTETTTAPLVVKRGRGRPRKTPVAVPTQ